LRQTATLSEDGAKALQAVRGLVASLSRTARLVEQRTGMSNAQVFLLQQIAAESDLSVNELAARAMTHQSTASVVLSRLERRGLVRRVRSPDDARSVVLRLTPAGRRVLRRAPAPATSAIVAAIARLSTREVKMLRAGLAALAREAGFTLDDSPMLFQESDGAMGKSRRNSARRIPRAGPTGMRSRTTAKR
jgi:DNA-binding MarR family transcriptional regulator